MRRHNLGLHTLPEQAYALRKANEVYEKAVKSIADGDAGAGIYGLGYLSAIYDLATDEGAPGLAADVKTLGDSLARLTSGRRIGM